jgi:LruC domain-containing protein
MKKIFSLLAISFVFQACNKEEETATTIVDNTSFETLVAPADFNWSSSKSGLIDVSLVAASTMPMDLNGGLLLIKDSQGHTLAQEKITNNTVSFNVNLPALQTGLVYNLPATGEEWPLDGLGSVSLNLTDPLDVANGNKSNKNAFHKQNALPPGVNIIGNSDFEINDFASNVGFAYNPTSGTVDDGKWYISDNDYTWATEGGSNVIKATPGDWTHIWQLHTVNAGDSIYFNSDFSGNVRAFLFFYTNSSTPSRLSYEYLDLANNSEGIKTIVPAGATVVSALLNFNNSSWVDNAFLSNPAAIVDADGDGVADGDDDFPNDPSRAYVSYWPISGRQTIAFEDLWPSKGDYDFNDLIVNVKVTLSRDASLQWVSADYEVALDAVGAGLGSGLAMRLVDLNKQAKTNMLASVTGDASLDPDVTNGIIVFDNPDELRSEFYTNTDPNQTPTVPDTAKFTLNFSANDAVYFYPDFYIYRTSNRGREVHLPGFTGTSEADPSLYNIDDDVNGTYKTANGLPWAMELILDGSNFKHPSETIDMIEAYPNFGNWASSGGSSFGDWYQAPSPGKTIDISGN